MIVDSSNAHRETTPGIFQNNASGRDNVTAEVPPVDNSLLRLYRRVARQFAFVGLLIIASCRSASVLRLNGGQSEL